MLRIAIYARVSSEDQADDDRVSIDSQRADGRARADQVKGEVVEEYVDDRRYRVGKRLVEPAGWRTDRPAWLKMFSDARAHHFDMIIAWREDRLYRGYRPMLDFLELIESTGVKVQLCKEHFDPAFAPVKAWAAKMENDARRDRVSMGQVGRARERGLPTTSVPRGYNAVRDPVTGRSVGYEIDPPWQPWFDRLASLFLEHHPYHVIARRMATYPDIVKRPHPSSVERMLKNPIYRGFIAFGRYRNHGRAVFVVRGKQPPMWSEAICHSIEQELERRAALGLSGPRNRGHGGNLFTGILRCGYCLRPMTGHSVSQKRKPGYIQYACPYSATSHKGFGLPEHRANSIVEVKILRWLREQIGQLKADELDAFIDQVEDAPKPTDPGHAGVLERELVRANQQVAEIEADLKVIKSRASRDPLEAEQARLKDYIGELEKEAAKAAASVEIDVEAIRAAAHLLVEHPEMLDPDLTSREELRGVLMAVVPVLYVAKGQIFTSLDGMRNVLGILEYATHTPAAEAYRKLAEVVDR